MENKSSWISVNDRTPKNSNEVLVYSPGRTIIGPKLIGCFFKGNKRKGHKPSWTVYDFGGSDLDALVTHWQPLPQNP